MLEKPTITYPSNNFPIFNVTQNVIAVMTAYPTVGWNQMRPGLEAIC